MRKTFLLSNEYAKLTMAATCYKKTTIHNTIGIISILRGGIVENVQEEVRQ